ncbi:MAG: GspE/PulE family protein [Desulfurivibrionaceae bacterium]|nr:GspE/PulE family protein [Desulfurivibrionaceae bacterium]
MERKGKLGKLLLEREVISQEQLDDALAQQGELGLPLGETLIRLDYINENQLLDFLSRQLKVDFINLSENDYQVIDRSLINLLTRDLCRRYQILPLFLFEIDDTRQLTLAMTDPLDADAVHEVENKTDCLVTPVLTISSDLEEGIERLFGGGFFPSRFGAETRPLIEENRVLFMNRLLAQAIQLYASDIHVEPHTREAHIRYRIDGVLHLMQTIPLETMPPLITLLKIMGSQHHTTMRLDKKNIPHEGSFARIIGGHAVDFRVSTFPTIHGEKAAVRILDKNSRVAISTTADLEMAPKTLRIFLSCIRQASGIVIATGPTGSGKTTTLHAAINEINDVGLNIVTIEDPVEYHAADFVNQSTLLPQAGFTYPLAMHAVLRQDPDVILVGEVRDLETARVVIQAALTGHLVLTTMHTDDAAGAVVRLVDLGIEEFLVSSTVVSSINQRLVRKNCPDCSKKYTPGREELEDIGIDAGVAEEIVKDRILYNIRKGKGCQQCRHTGYRGRHGVYEFLSVNPPIKKMIRDKVTSDVISSTARELQDINMLFEDGLRLVLSGITTFDELRRIPRGDYSLKSPAGIFKTAGIDAYPKKRKKSKSVGAKSGRKKGPPGKTK